MITDATTQLLKYRLSDLEEELIAQDKKGNLKNGAGVYLLVLLNKAINTLDNVSAKGKTVQWFHLK